MSDLISRADAIEAVAQQWLFEASVGNPYVNDDDIGEYRKLAEELFEDVPSADAVSRKAKCCPIAETCMSIDCPVSSEYIGRPSAEAVQGEWIPVSEMLPEDIKPVIVTWKNTDPKSYYQYIVGKHFIGTAHYKSGKWYWYSSVTEDLLAEYGKCDSEEFDEAIEVVDWMPLPTPYKGGDDE